MGGCCVGDCKIGNLPDKQENLKSHAEKIADELENNKSEAQARTKNIEAMIYADFDESMKDLSQWLEELNNADYADHKLNIDIDKLKQIDSNLVKELTGFIYNKIENRLDLKDKELSIILAETDDKLRKNNLDSFYERIFRNAIKDLIVHLEHTINYQGEVIINSIQALEDEVQGAGEFYAQLEDLKQQAQGKTQRRSDLICNKLREHVASSNKNFPGHSIRLRDIALMLGCKVVGDENIEVTSLKFAGDADENSLAIAYSDRDVKNTAAKSVLTSPRMLPIDKNFIYCEFGEIDAALVKVARLMIAEGFYPDYEKPFEQTDINAVQVGQNIEIGEGTYMAPFVSIGENVIIGKNCKIESNVFIGSGSQIGNDVIIRSGSRIGVNCHYHYAQNGRHNSFCGVGRTILEDGVEIGCNTVIQRGTLSDTVIGAGTIIGNLVEIAHDVKIGKGCLIVSQVGICGNVKIGDHVQIYGQAGVVNWVEIEDNAVILSRARVTKNVRAGAKISGLFTNEHAEELKYQAKLRKLTKGE